MCLNTELDKWLESKGADLTDEDLNSAVTSGCMIYAEPWAANEVVRNYIRGIGLFGKLRFPKKVIYSGDFGKGQTLSKQPCYMCDSVWVSFNLEDGFDCSAIVVGDTASMSKRFMICSGNNQPVHLRFEIFDTEFKRWVLSGRYYPKFCPNCGRELSEYYVEDCGTGAYEKAMVGDFEE